MIDLKDEGARWTITLNRPEKANALSVSMLQELDRVFSQARDSRDLRALIITGAGNRVFSAGADLGQAKGGQDFTTNPVWESVSNRLAHLPVLTIAALNGTLAGGAFGMALACDLRLAVPTAHFFYPVLKNGFLPQPSDVGRMRDLIGPARTRMILLAGQKIAADEALSWGLIDRIVESDHFPAQISALTKAAENAGPAGLAAIKGLTGSDVTPEMRADCYRAVYQQDSDALQRIRR